MEQGRTNDAVEYCKSVAKLSKRDFVGRSRPLVHGHQKSHHFPNLAGHKRNRRRSYRDREALRVAVMPRPRRDGRGGRLAVLCGMWNCWDDIFGKGLRYRLSSTSTQPVTTCVLFRILSENKTRVVHGWWRSVKKIKRGVLWQKRSRLGARNRVRGVRSRGQP